MTKVTSGLQNYWRMAYTAIGIGGNPFRLAEGGLGIITGGNTAAVLLFLL